MTVHLWEGTAHPRSNIEARATFAKDIYNKDSPFSPRIFVRILTRYCMQQLAQFVFSPHRPKRILSSTRHCTHVFTKGSKSGPKVFSCSHEAFRLRS